MRILNIESLPKVAYVVKRYPRFSETFIVNEILAHEAAGLDIEIFSLRPTVDTHFQDLLSRVRAPVTCLSPGMVKAESLWQSVIVAGQVAPRVHQAMPQLCKESALDVYCACQLAMKVVANGITHLHAHFATSAATVARLASLMTGIPYSLTAHAKDIFHESVDEADLERKLRDARVSFTVSDFNRKDLKRRFPQSTTSLVRLYNGLPLEDFPYQSPLQRVPSIVAVGRLVEKKGFADLITACRILRDQGMAWNCQIIGSGELQDSLQQQIQQFDLQGRVTLLGSLPQRDVKQRVQEAAVLVAPCVEGEDGNRDGMPTVLLEAMALGTPCLSTRVTGIPELISHQSNGWLVEPHQPEALAQAIAVLLTDRALRVKLAEQARQRIETEFDILQNAERQRQYFEAGHVSEFSTAAYSY